MSALTLTRLDPLVERIGGRRRATILATGVAATLLILGLSWWATAPTWVPVFSDLPLESVGEMTDRLGEAGIEFQLEDGGRGVMVASSDVARARVVLAREGLPATGRPGLELFDQPSWGMTDFTQRINYRRALEGELERTISKMRGVEAAQVHLAMHEGSSFRRADRPGEASVVLGLRGGGEASPDVVQGIQHLVSSSVDGLESDNVMVLDDAGRLLSAPNEPGSLAALTHRQLAMQREVEQHLESKAERMVSQIVGPGNARVQVAAQINFDRVERTTEAVDPERQALASEQRSEIVPGAEGGAGSSSTSAAYENSRSLETFSGSVGGVNRLTVAVLVNDRETGGEGAPETEPRSPQELTRIETLVGSAVGLDARRGDVISVVGMPFNAAPADAEEPMDVWTVVAGVQKPVITLVALLLAFVLALRVIRSLRAPEPQIAEAVPMLASAEGELALAGVAAEAELQAAPEIPALPPVPTVRDRVIEIVDERPDVAARLVRAWLKEG